VRSAGQLVRGADALGQQPRACQLGPPGDRGVASGIDARLLGEGLGDQQLGRGAHAAGLGQRALGLGDGGPVHHGDADPVERTWQERTGSSREFGVAGDARGQ
jgi:hypothetical protein